MAKTILIYGGNSLISKELIKILDKENCNFIIFCRNSEIFFETISSLKIEKNKFNVFEADLLDLDKNLQLISSLHNNIDGLIWVAGVTGDPAAEFMDTKLCEKNIKINFLHPVLIINNLINKININKHSFIAVITSVAGLRGRATNLYFCSAKSALISFLSGLRQKFRGKINILTVIPGYINTKSFDKNLKTLNKKAPKFLVTSPEKAAHIITKAIKLRKEIVYINFLWRIIVLIISIIPEKIFKKLNF